MPRKFAIFLHTLGLQRKVELIAVQAPAPVRHVLPGPTQSKQVLDYSFTQRTHKGDQAGSAQTI